MINSIVLVLGLVGPVGFEFVCLLSLAMIEGNCLVQSACIILMFSMAIKL